MVDRFAMDVQAGQRVSFEAVGNRFGKEVDPLVIIRDAKGHIVAERDNDPGLYFDFRFEHRFADAGTYLVEMRTHVITGMNTASMSCVWATFLPRGWPFLPWSSRQAHHAVPARTECHLADRCFRHATCGAIVDRARQPDDEGSTWLPVEVSDAETTTASVDAVTPERDHGEDSRAAMRCPGEARGATVFPPRNDERPGDSGYRPFARRLNSPVDLDLALTDAMGKTLRTATEGTDDTVKLDFKAPAAAVYCLAVRDLARDGGPAFTYRLDVRTDSPQVGIVAEVEGLTVPRDNYQPIPLTVARNGYAGPIALSLEGAPAGVTLTPNEIPAGANAIVCKLSARATTPLGLHTFQILFQTGDKSPKTLVRTRPMIDRQLMNVDLIPYSLREDQRRLPPSVHDRFALQVTEASPFTVELAGRR